MRRPAVVVSDGLVGSAAIPLAWALMITNAKRAPWPGDLLISDHVAVGLNIPCKVRTARVETIDAQAAEHVGRLPGDMLEVRRHVRATIGWCVA